MRMNAKRTPAIAGGILVLLLGACSSIVQSPNESVSAAMLAAKVKDAYAGADWYPTLQQAADLPNVQTVTSTAFVFTNIANTDLGKASALRICHDVAAVTSETPWIRRVKVEAGQAELASCDVPAP